MNAIARTWIPSVAACTAAACVLTLTGCDDTSWNILESETTELKVSIPAPWNGAISESCIIKKVSNTEDEYLICFYDYDDDKQDMLTLCEPGKSLINCLPGSAEKRKALKLPPVLRLDMLAGTASEVTWDEWAKCSEQISDRSVFLNGKCWSSLGLERGESEKSLGILDGKPIRSAAPYIQSAIGHGSGSTFLLMSRFGPTESKGGLFAPSVVVALGDLVIEWRDTKTFERIGPAVRIADSAMKHYEDAPNCATGWTWDQKYLVLLVNNRLFIVKCPAPLKEPDPAGKVQKQPSQTATPSVPNVPDGKP